MKKTVLILSALFLSLIGFSQTFTDGNFTYYVISETDVGVSDYDMAGGPDVIVPTTVTNDATTYNVTYIGYQAFMSNELTSVTIPEGITTIVNGAFLFNNLSTVTIPNSVTHIWDAAFGSNELTSVVLGENLIHIGSNAFNGNQLTSFTFPPGVTTIEKQVFANNNFTDLIIPNGITAIGEGAFIGNPLTSVTSINTTPPTIYTAVDISESFANDRSEIYLYVPFGTEAAYATDLGAQWTGFKSVTEIGFAGMEDSYLSNELNIYPNPVNSQFTIDSEEVIENIIILNSNGSIVKAIVNPNHTIDADNLTPGIYFLKIQTENGWVNQKFIKQ